MNKCPTCQSPNPKHHPAVQWGGEVHLCRDQWHKPTDRVVPCTIVFEEPKK